MFELRQTLWLTGRPCAGKSTIAARLVEEMKKRGIHVARLEGDDVRRGLNSDLGFSDSDRLENLRRVAYVAQLFNDNDQFVIATFVSPTNEMRALIRGIVKNIKICYVRCAPEECERRDVKGLYKLARAGKIKDFTGVSDPFEEPDRPEIIVETDHWDLETCIRRILKAVHFP